MKNIFVLCATFLLVFFIISCTKNSVEDTKATEDSQLVETAIRDVGESCAPNTVGTGGCEPGIFTHTISIPSYPGCLFDISADYLYCQASLGQASTHFQDFEIIFHECPQYEIDLEAANATNKLHEFQTQINQEVWASITESFLSILPIQANTALYFEYIVSQCTRTCYVKKEFGKDNPITAIVPVKISCGTNCCRRVDIYNSDGNGNWGEPTDNSFIESVNSICEFIGLATCIRNTVFSTDCDDNCTSLDFQ